MHTGRGYRAAQPRYFSPDFIYSLGVPNRYYFFGNCETTSGLVIFAEGAIKSTGAVYNAALVAFEWTFSCSDILGNVYAVFMRDSVNLFAPGRVLLLSIIGAAGRSWLIFGPYEIPPGDNWNNQFVTDVDFDINVTGDALPGCFLFRQPLDYANE